MLTIFVRTVILYALSVLAVRLMGKRQVGQLQPYEFVLALMIAELAAAPMEGVGTPLLYGVVPILGMMALHGLVTLLTVKSTALRRLLSGGPSVIIRDGIIQYEEMKRMCYSTSDLMEELRAQGFLNVADVSTAVLETTGKLSAFPKGEKRPVTPADLSLSPVDEGIPLTLIVDGRAQRDHLARCGLSRQWLGERLKKMGYQKESQVLLAVLDRSGVLSLQGKDGRAASCQAMKAEEAEGRLCGP